MHSIISVEVAFYKLSIQDSRLTIYNEASSKQYFNPLRLFALVNKEDILMNDVDTGMDISQNVTFSFLRDDLKDIDLVISEGDIIKFNGKFFEVDNSSQNQYWMGRNPDTLLTNVENRTNLKFGYNITIKCQTHQTRISTLNLVEVRSGINTIKTNLNLPRNL